MRMEGFLRKRNKHGKWQQRWFVLGASELRYFESATSSVPKGVIPLGGIASVTRTRVIDREPFCLSVRCRDRTYALSAPSDDAARNWCAAISSAQHAPDDAAAVTQTRGARAASEDALIRKSGIYSI